MRESTIVAQRLPYKGIYQAGGVMQVAITPEMEKKFKNAM